MWAVSDWMPFLIPWRELEKASKIFTFSKKTYGLMNAFFTGKAVYVTEQTQFK